jgi:hypothetical protein
MPRSSYFFAPPETSYRRIALYSTYSDFDIEAQVTDHIDGNLTQLTKDAASLKITRTKLDDQRKLLKKAGTITANIKTQILKHRNQIDRFNDLLARSGNDLVRAQLIEKQETAQAALENALQRQSAVAREIPRIKTALNQLQTNNMAAAKKFIRHYPWQFWLNEKMYQSFLAIEFTFVPYTLKTLGLSVISCASAWKLPAPTPELALYTALPFTLMDFLVNVLVFDPHATAIDEQFDFYEKHKFKSYKRIMLDALTDSVSRFTLTSLLMGLFNTLTLETHNTVGGASTIYGVKDSWPFNAIGEWQLALYIPMLITATGYYSKVLDPKYYAGMQDNKAYRQVFNTLLKLFSKDYPRAFDVLYRGVFSTAFLRALSFYFLGAQVRDMSALLKFVDPKIIFLLVFHHTLATRFSKAYEPSFGKKEFELPQIFVDLKIKKARDQVMAGKLKTIYDAQVLRFKDKNKTEDQLRMLATVKLKKSLVAAELENIELQALKLAAGMNLDYVHDARLTIEREQQRARARIRFKAQKEAAEYLFDQTQELMELRTWQDFANDLRSSFVIGTLRGLFGYILMSTYGMQLIEVLSDGYLSKDNTEYVRVSTSLTMALVFFVIYFDSCKQAELDARVVACHTDDHINEVADIVAADDAIEKELEEEKEARFSPALHATLESKEQELIEIIPSSDSPRSEHKAEEPSLQVNMHTTLMVTNISSVVMTGGSCVIRVVSNVYPTIFFFIGLLDEMALVSLITLSLAEGCALGYNMFIDDVSESILSRLTRSKMFQSLITTQDRTEATAASRNTVSTFHRVWSIFKSRPQNAHSSPANHELLPLLPAPVSAINAQLKI